MERGSIAYDFAGVIVDRVLEAMRPILGRGDLKLHAEQVERRRHDRKTGHRSRDRCRFHVEPVGQPVVAQHDVGLPAAGLELLGQACAAVTRSDVEGPQAASTAPSANAAGRRRRETMNITAAGRGTASS